MAGDKKQRLVPGAMYIPPTPTPTAPASTDTPSSAASSATSPVACASAKASGSSGKSPPSTATTSSSGSKPASASVAATSPSSPATASASNKAASSSSSSSSSPSASSSSASKSLATGSSATTRALTPHRHLSELLQAVDAKFCFQPAVEELLLDMASEFVSDVVSFSSRLTKHRRSTVLEPKDLQFCLAKNYGVSLAGVLQGSQPSPSSGVSGAAASPRGTSPKAASSSSSLGVGGASALLNPIGSDVVVRSRPGKNSLHMHRLALKRKALQRTTDATSKLKKGGILKASGTGAARKTVQRKGSNAGVGSK